MQSAMTPDLGLVVSVLTITDADTSVILSVLKLEILRTTGVTNGSYMYFLSFVASPIAPSFSTLFYFLVATHLIFDQRSDLPETFNVFPFLFVQRWDNSSRITKVYEKIATALVQVYALKPRSPTAPRRKTKFSFPERQKFVRFAKTMSEQNSKGWPDATRKSRAIRKVNIEIDWQIILWIKVDKSVITRNYSLVFFSKLRRAALIVDKKLINLSLLIDNLFELDHGWWLPASQYCEAKLFCSQNTLRIFPI